MSFAFRTGDLSADYASAIPIITAAASGAYNYARDANAFADKVQYLRNTVSRFWGKSPRTSTVDIATTRPSSKQIIPHFTSGSSGFSARTSYPSFKSVRRSSYSKYRRSFKQSKYRRARVYRIPRSGTARGTSTMRGTSYRARLAGRFRRKYGRL